MKDFLKVRKQHIIDANGHPVVLQGINLGGWLLMEGYILHSPNFGVRFFKKDFEKKLGKHALKDFEGSFRDHFIREADIKRIAVYGFNCIRVPFHYGLVEKKPYRYDDQGLAYLDRVVQWAKKHNIWVILDLHAACGAQSCDWHADSSGEAKLWTNKAYQRRTVALWTFLAQRYKDEKAIAGYDVLNEAVVENPRVLNLFYKNLIRAIRRADSNHILFVEGNKWAMDLGCLDIFDDDNLALSIHAYQPLDLTFNFVPQLTYPLKTNGKVFGKQALRKMLSQYASIAKRRCRPIFVGEFGVNARQGQGGEDRWLADTLSVFREFGFHWTYWTYKAVKHSVFPDGLLSYLANPPWVHRQGPLTGWDTYSLYWPQRRQEIIDSWRTEHFTVNKEVLNVLRKNLKKRS